MISNSNRTNHKHWCDENEGKMERGFVIYSFDLTSHVNQIKFVWIAFKVPPSFTENIQCKKCRHAYQEVQTHLFLSSPLPLVHLMRRWQTVFQCTNRLLSNGCNRKMMMMIMDLIDWNMRYTDIATATINVQVPSILETYNTNFPPFSTAARQWK